MSVNLTALLKPYSNNLALTEFEIQFGSHNCVIKKISFEKHGRLHLDPQCLNYSKPRCQKLAGFFLFKTDSFKYYI